MIKQYFTQAWAQLRQQPIISAVSIAGTALAIFLIMLVVMMQQVKVAPFAPESNRDRFLHAHYMSITNQNWGGGSSNGPMSAKTARECFQTLKTPEAVTIYTCMVISTPVNLPGQPSIGIDLLQTDDIFWRVFDFSFIGGLMIRQRSMLGYRWRLLRKVWQRNCFKVRMLKDVSSC